MNAQPQHSEQPKSQHFCLSNADKGVISETKIHRDHFQKQINFVKQFQKEITSACPHLDQAHTFPKTHLAGDCGVVNELKEMEAVSMLWDKINSTEISFIVTEAAGNHHRMEKKGDSFVQGVQSGKEDFICAMNGSWIIMEDTQRPKFYPISILQD